MEHSFRIYEGKFWCENEDVVSEECTDYDRCNHECVCNHDVEYSCCECGSQDHTCQECTIFMMDAEEFVDWEEVEVQENEYKAYRDY